MSEKNVWLLYDRADFNVNRDFAAWMAERGRAHGLTIQTVTLDELRLQMDGGGTPLVIRNGQEERPLAVISRMREALVSRHLEAMGLPVFNGAQVCEICNDKRRTHLFLHGLPMPETEFLSQPFSPPEAGYPLVVKPAGSHGGDRVRLVRNQEEWRVAVGDIPPMAALQQRVVSSAGRDLRVYVLFGQILAAVMRTAKSGIVSNYKLGGRVALHALTPAEEALALTVIRRFEQAGAPLCFAGVDLLYQGDTPVVGEVEDVVGSRMLYRVGGPDVIDLYVGGLAKRLENRR